MISRGKTAGSRAALGLALATAAAALPACGGGSGGGGAAAAGTHTIRTVGGEGARGDGGAGGGLIVLGGPGAPIRMLRSGEADASFAVPSERPALGANPRVITTDTSVTPVDDSIPGGVDPLSPATGLEVKKGAVLTILGAEASEIELSDGVIVAGEIRAGRLGVAIEAASARIEEGAAIVCAAPLADEEPSGLTILCAGAIVNLGALRTAGADGAQGGPGGPIALQVEGSGGIFNAGTIDASGGAGSSDRGGPGGEVTLQVRGIGGVFHSGSIASRGGRGATSGGSGGDVTLGVQEQGQSLGGVASPGTIDASGGQGAGGSGDAGGDGGRVTLVGSGEDARVSGAIASRGGAGPAVEGGLGGAGGVVAVAVLPFSTEPGAPVSEGDLLVSADIDTRGGDAATGGGGGLVIIIDPSADPKFGVELDTTAFTEAHEIAITGYRLIDVSGGASTGGAGGAAAVLGEEGAQLASVARVFTPSGVLIRSTTLEGAGGDIFDEIDLVGRGGDGASTEDADASGGAGATVELSKGPRRDDARPQPVFAVRHTVESRGRMDLRGGAGVLGGRGGALGLLDAAHVVSAGEVLLDGGAGREGQGPGAGAPGGIFLAVTHGLLESEGAISAAGGGCDGGAGGRGGFAGLLGGEVRSGAAIRADGGAGATGGAGGATRGEAGERVELYFDLLFGALPLPLEQFDPEGDFPLGGVALQSLDASSEVGAEITAEGGAGVSEDGEGDGEDGTVAVDGVFVEGGRVRR